METKDHEGGSVAREAGAVLGCGDMIAKILMTHMDEMGISVNVSDGKKADKLPRCTNCFHICTNCNHGAHQTCKRCNVAHYCSPECQVAHRSEHKPVCWVLEKCRNAGQHDYVKMHRHLEAGERLGVMQAIAYIKHWQEYASENQTTRQTHPHEPRDLFTKFVCCTVPTIEQVYFLFSFLKDKPVFEIAAGNAWLRDLLADLAKNTGLPKLDWVCSDNNPFPYLESNVIIADAFQMVNHVWPGKFKVLAMFWPEFSDAKYVARIIEYLVTLDDPPFILYMGEWKDASSMGEPSFTMLLQHYEAVWKMIPTRFPHTIDSIVWFKPKDRPT